MFLEEISEPIQESPKYVDFNNPKHTRQKTETYSPDTSQSNSPATSPRSPQKLSSFNIKVTNSTVNQQNSPQKTANADLTMNSDLVDDESKVDETDFININTNSLNQQNMKHKNIKGQAKIENLQLDDN